MQWNNRIFFAAKKHLYFHDFICELRVVVSYLEAIVAFSWLSQAQWWCLYSSWMCQCWWYSQGHLYLYLRLSFAHFLCTFVCMYVSFWFWMDFIMHALLAVMKISKYLFAYFVWLRFSFISVGFVVVVANN